MNHLTSSTKNVLLFSALIGMTVFSSCDMNGKDNKDQTALDSSLSKVDTIAAPPIKKMRKPKISLAAMGADNNKIEKDKDGVYSRAEAMPVYPGGDDAMKTYIENNITYPQQAVDQDVEGTVRVSFIVDEKGNVVKPIVAGTNAGNGLDEEALRVVQKMPKWKPGVVKGKAVKTRLSLPITFQLAES